MKKNHTSLKSSTAIFFSFTQLTSFKRETSPVKAESDLWAKCACFFSSTIQCTQLFKFTYLLGLSCRVGMKNFSVWGKIIIDFATASVRRVRAASFYFCAYQKKFFLSFFQVWSNLRNFNFSVKLWKKWSSKFYDPSGFNYNPARILSDEFSDKKIIIEKFLW